MTDKHTPGSWEVDFHDAGTGNCQWCIVREDGDTVAVSPVGPQAFNKANARLIAAAPALLEALKTTWKQLESTRLTLHTSLCQEFDTCVDSCIEGQQQGLEARAAIKAAKGDA